MNQPRHREGAGTPFRTRPGFQKARPRWHPIDPTVKSMLGKMDRKLRKRVPVSSSASTASSRGESPGLAVRCASNMVGATRTAP